jgi:hypothetical protein
VYRGLGRRQRQQFRWWFLRRIAVWGLAVSQHAPARGAHLTGPAADRERGRVSRPDMTRGERACAPPSSCRGCYRDALSWAAPLPVARNANRAIRDCGSGMTWDGCVARGSHHRQRIARLNKFRYSKPRQRRCGRHAHPYQDAQGIARATGIPVSEALAQSERDSAFAVALADMTVYRR